MYVQDEVMPKTQKRRSCPSKQETGDVIADDDDEVAQRIAIAQYTIPAKSNKSSLAIKVVKLKHGTLIGVNRFNPFNGLNRMK